MSGRLRWILALNLLTIASCQTYGQEKSAFTMPESVLLFGSPDFELHIVTGTSEQILKPLATQGAFNYPGLTSDGSRVAWGFAAESGGAGQGRRFVLGVSPTTKREWKTYGDFEDVGAAAFSADRSRVAFTAVQTGRRSSFLILDLSSGETEIIASLSGVTERAILSWSPDGKRVVVELQEPDQTTAIYVADLGTGDLKVIGKGVDPAWSPTGEWIVYFDAARQKCILVHPDGANPKVVRNLSRNLFQYRMFAYGAVWSPDGKQLLLNEMKGEGPNVDVMLLDPASRKVTKKSRNGLAVFGWGHRKPD